jgi:uncharacterized membrane protein
MDETPGKRLLREYCWFALVLLALMVGFSKHLTSTEVAASRDGPGAVQLAR